MSNSLSSELSDDNDVGAAEAVAEATPPTERRKQRRRSLSPRSQVRQAEDERIEQMCAICSTGQVGKADALLRDHPNRFAVVCGMARGTFPLLAASRAGSAEGIEWLLRAGADVNQRSVPKYNTPLMVAAKHGHTACVDLLLEYGANPYLTNRKGITAQRFALHGKHGVLAGHIAQQTKAQADYLPKKVRESAQNDLACVV